MWCKVSGTYIYIYTCTHTRLNGYKTKKGSGMLPEIPSNTIWKTLIAFKLTQSGECLGETIKCKCWVFIVVVASSAVLNGDSRVWIVTCLILLHRTSWVSFGDDILVPLWFDVWSGYSTRIYTSIYFRICSIYLYIYMYMHIQYLFIIHIVV